MTPTSTQKEIAAFMSNLKAKNPNESEFHQAVEEVIISIIPFIEKNPKYKKAKILERLTEPERIITFRVVWIDDKGEMQINKGYRVQFNSAIGPYKGGLRFHPSVNLSILKFLGFEQTFKNSLTTLPMGGAKGGADFDPKGKSDREIMNFCQAFMSELSKYIGPNTDIPAGDIGVGTKEIGYLFGQYKRLRNEFTGVLTGKGVAWGGSLIRTEATGYGVVYFAEEMLKTRGQQLQGKVCVVSGSGNVAQYTVEKLIAKGAKVVTVSDSSGYIYDKEGIDKKKLEFIQSLKNEKKGRIKEYADKFKCKYVPNKKPWEVSCQIALPCATQNEITRADAETLVKNKVMIVAEGANMPTTKEGAEVFLKKQILFAPGKAANAGGVATSCLEMTQNSLHTSWTRDEVDAKLYKIMVNIHQQCVNHGREGPYTNYVNGANIAGFIKVADAMLAQGVV